MDKMKDLLDLLKHEVQDLYSVEEQIIAAMPLMIEKASNWELKKALQTHLKVTQKQLSRLEQVQNMMGIEQENDEKKGLFSRLFKSRQVCKGMQGIIEEGNKVMKEDMNEDVLDAAIIASAQKIEHYEICGYGTARTYARELGLNEVGQLLETTLNEEYAADDLLTKLAVTGINKEAEGNSRSQKSSDVAGMQKQRTPQKTKMPEAEMEMVSDNKGSDGTNTRKRSGHAEGPQKKEVTRLSSSPQRPAGTKRTNASRERSNSKSTQVNRKETSTGKGRRSSENDTRTR
jgi:ferritin-like metal-binding protein YciE